MKPINDRVVVKPAPAEEKTKGGIIIPDTAKEKPQKGKVIAVGFFAVGVLSSGGTQIGYFIAAVAAWVLGAYAPLLRRFF